MSKQSASILTLLVLTLTTAVASSPARGQRAGACPEGQSSSHGHCCATGQQWVAARRACAYVMADRCPSGTTRADSTTCCARARAGGPADCFTRGTTDPDTDAVDCPPGMLMAVNDATHGVWCVRAPTERLVSLRCGDHRGDFAVSIRFFEEPATVGGRVEVRYPRMAEPIVGSWGYYSTTEDGHVEVFVHTPGTVWRLPYAATAPGTAITGALRTRADGSEVSCTGRFDALESATSTDECPSGAIPRSDGTCAPGLVGQSLVVSCGPLTDTLTLAPGGVATDVDDEGSSTAMVWSAHELEQGGGVLVALGFPQDSFPPQIAFRFVLDRTTPGASFVGTTYDHESCTGRVQAPTPSASTPPSAPAPAPAPPPAPPAPPVVAPTPSPPPSATAAATAGASLAETNEWIRTHMVGLGFVVSGLRESAAYPDIEAFAVTDARLDGCNVTIERTTLYASLFSAGSLGNRWQVDHAWADRMTFSWGSLVPGSVASHVEWTPASGGAVSYVEAQARGASVSFHPLPAVPAWLPPAILAHSRRVISHPEAIVPLLAGWFASPRSDGTRSTVSLVFEHGDASWQTRAVEAVRHAIELCGGHADTF